MLSKVEIFDKVSAHLINQAERSVAMVQVRGKLTSTCAYRGDNGLMCAVGVLIKDEFYNSEFENRTSLAQPVRKALTASGVNMSDNEIALMLNALQAVHDNDDVDAWPESLAAIRKELV